MKALILKLFFSSFVVLMGLNLSAYAWSSYTGQTSGNSYVHAYGSGFSYWNKDSEGHCSAVNRAIALAFANNTVYDRVSGISYNQIEARCGAKYASGDGGRWHANAAISALDQTFSVNCSNRYFVSGFCEVVIREYEKKEIDYIKCGVRSIVQRLAPFSQNEFTISLAPEMPPCPTRPPNNSIESIRRFDIISANVTYWCSDGARHEEEDGCATCGDPINVTGGRVHQKERDISLPTPGIPLEFVRFYSSTMSNSTSAMGARWTHNYASSVEQTNQVFVKRNTTSILGNYTNTWLVLNESGVFHWSPLIVQSGGVAYATTSGEYWNPIVTSNGETVITKQSGDEFYYDTNGMLTMISDWTGNFILLIYTNNYPNQQLIKAQHSNGQYLEFSYSNAMISSVTTPSTNLSVRYYYNDRGELTNRTILVNEQPSSRYYYYDNHPTIWTHCMTQMLTETGNQWCWEYEADTNGVLTSRGVRSWLEQSNRYDMTINYTNTNLGISYVSYANGSSTNMYQYEFNPMTKRIQAIYGPNMINQVEWRGVRYELDDYGNRIEAFEADYRRNISEWAKRKMPFDPFGDHPTNYAYGYMAEPSNVWVYTWNTNNHLIESICDPEGNQIGYNYTNALLLSEQYFLTTNEMLETSYGYTTNGLLVACTNANGHVTAYSYDDLGFPAGITPPEGPGILFSNNILGQVVRMTFGGERSVGLDVDPLGRVHCVDYPDGTYEAFTYDAGGQLIARQDQGGRMTTNAWYPGGKLASMTRCGSATNLTVRYNYDQQFNTLEIRDELDRPVENYLLDDADRPYQIGNVDTQTLFITYGLGNYIKSMQRFDGTIISNQYNGDGLIARRDYVRGATIQTNIADTFEYYRNGRLKAARCLERNTSSSTYSTRVAHTNSYDGVGRLTNEIFSSSLINWTLRREYDAMGHVTNLTEQQLGGLDYQFSYDDAERLQQITSEAGMFEYTYSTNSGLPECLTFPNNLTAHYTRDVMDRVTAINYKDTNDVSQAALQYSYDSVGMITQKCITIHGTNSVHAYQYDDFNRLVTETMNGVRREYTYDAAGNRLSKSIPSGEVAYYRVTPGNRMVSWTYGATNPYSATIIGNSSEPIGTDDRWGQLWVSNQTRVTPWVDGTNFGVEALPITPGTNCIVAAIHDTAGNTTVITNNCVFSPTVFTNGVYAYNAAGCVTQMIYASAAETRTLSLSWNLKYQLTRMESTQGVTRCDYDAFGRRDKMTVNGTNTFFIYDGLHLIAEADEYLFLTKKYTYGAGIDNILSMTTVNDEQTNTYFYLKDHQNSVIALADEDGQIVETYTYDAWGRTRVFDAEGNELTASAFGNQFAWQGREIDWSTGLYYFRARYYDPITGRWLSNDPIGISGGLNQYVFCANNPVNFTDPMGLCEGEGPNYSGWGNTYGFAAGAELFGIGNAVAILGFPEVGPLSVVGALPFWFSGGALIWGSAKGPGLGFDFYCIKLPEIEVNIPSIIDDMIDQGYNPDDPSDEYDYWYDTFTTGFGM